MILQHVREEPEPVSTRTELDVPPALDRVLLDCLAKDPRDRPVDALELSGRLARVEAEVEPWSSERAERWWTTHRATLLPSRPESATAEAGATVQATETS
jgi:serine/threonine-protein kinase